MREKYLNILLDNFTTEEVFELIRDGNGIESQDIIAMMFVWIKGMHRDKILELLKIDNSNDEIEWLKNNEYDQIIEFASSPRKWNDLKARVKELQQ